MIQTEYHCTREDGIKLYRTQSDAFVKIRRKGTDEVFLYAIDEETSIGEYEETDEEIIELRTSENHHNIGQSLWEHFLNETNE